MLVEWNSRNLVRRIHGPFELGFMLISARGFAGLKYSGIKFLRTARVAPR